MMKDILSKLKSVMDRVGDSAPARNKYFQIQLFERSQRKQRRNDFVSVFVLL